MNSFLLACAVCYGDPASPLVQGANMGVLFLLGVIVTLLVLFAGFFNYLSRRGTACRDRTGD